MVLLQILGAILILSFLIFIHELGHFLAAKKNGIKVEEFAIGFPPTLFKFKRGETDYKLNLIPFGGYVKLFGEDSFDPKVVKDKKSFASKTPWQKIQVLIAGVVMNFLVFWIFSSVALMNGGQPFILNSEQLNNLFLEKEVQYEVGLKGESAEEGYNYIFERNDQGLVELTKSEKLDNFVLLSAFRVNDIDDYWSEYLNSGDIIVEVNDYPVIDEVNFIEKLSHGEDGLADLKVFRDGEFVDMQVQYEFNYRVESLLEGVAMENDVQVGDLIESVNGVELDGNDSLRQINLENIGKELEYVFVRDGEEITKTFVVPESGLIGMYFVPNYVSPVMGFGYVVVDFPYTVESLKDYKFYEAGLVSLRDGWAISKLTATGFVGTILDVFFKFEVSEEIGGPVQVVKMSYEFVGLGGNDLLNFIALISLSLAVINILPIPALDGGRILFVVVEALRGKPLDRKLEAYIHGLGFMVLMLFIFVVTIFDFLRL